jgi:phospholipid/cholesterol/gamma-HCH transport system substrate-binding protein
MEMEFSRLERVVGTFIISVSMLLMAVLIIIGRGKDWFETYNTYYTSFNESYNLQENAAVKLFKADIGKVKQIVLEKDRVQVKLAILEKYTSRIRQDAVASVESPTFIGSEYISIIPGSPDAPLIPKQGNIPSREKRSLTDVLSDFKVEKTARLVLDAIQDISAVASSLNDPKGPLSSALNNIQETSQNIKQVSADLKAGKGPAGALLQSEVVLAKIQDNIDRVGDILENVNQATAKAPQTMNLVQENLVAYRDAGQAITERVAQAKAVLNNIEAAAGDLQTILANIRAGSVKVPRIANSFLDGVEEIREGVEQIDRVVDAIQKSVLVRGNLPPTPAAQIMDAGARP